jgi:DNA-binding transcriptional LysR family regulator
MADHLRTGRVGPPDPAPDWEDIRVFVALARHGSLSAAARALGVNHATVARRAASLEAHLGRSLFERRPAGYDLTEAGRATLAAAAAMESAAQAIARARDLPACSGLVRITATPSLADGFLIPRLVGLRQEAPLIDLEVNADARTLSLSRRAADIALRLTRPATGELLAQRVAMLGYGFYAAAALATGDGSDGAQERRRRDLDQSADGRRRNRAQDSNVAGQPLVGFSEALRDLPEAVWLTRHFPRHRIAFRANSQLAQAAAARAGFGVALLPHFIGGPDPALVGVASAERPPAREVWLVQRATARQEPRVRVAATWLAALFRRERALLEHGRAA